MNSENLITEFLDLVSEECGGDRSKIFLGQVESGLRVGQAFMNALTGTPYYGQLAGTSYDPFYAKSIWVTEEAIHRLTTKK